MIAERANTRSSCDEAIKLARRSSQSEGGSLLAAGHAKRTAVIASEAKQSSAPNWASAALDCFVARAPRNDGGDAVRSRGVVRYSIVKRPNRRASSPLFQSGSGRPVAFLSFPFLLPRRGARNDRAKPAPAAPAVFATGSPHAVGHGTQAVVQLNVRNPLS